MPLILAHLGVDLKAPSYPILQVQIREQRGRTLQMLDLTRLPPFIGPALAFHRAELHEALARSLPAGLVQFGCSYSPALVKGDILIGADEIYSAVREEVLGPVQTRLQRLHVLARNLS